MFFHRRKVGLIRDSYSRLVSSPFRPFPEEVNLVVADGKHFTTSRTATLWSKRFRKALEEDPELTTFEVHGISADIVRVVLEWMQAEEGNIFLRG